MISSSKNNENNGAPNNENGGIPNNDQKKMLTKVLQSGNINFLIGAGASLPAINVTNIETKLAEMTDEDGCKDDEINNEIYDFLCDIQASTNRLIDNETTNADIIETLKHYEEFLGTIEQILIERKNTILPRQANIFTTNYDLFIEQASLRYPILKLNDGFLRNPDPKHQYVFSSQNFFNTVFNNGYLYNYRVEVPSINLIKLHGSLSWIRNENNDILFNDKLTHPLEQDQKNPEEIREFNDSYAIVLPGRKKFQETILNQTYYDLLRLYANELDKENALLIVFGFSFNDEHILDITKRALKNITLQLLIFSYLPEDRARFSDMFKGHRNVTVIPPPQNGEKIDFTAFNKILADCTPFKNENSNECTRKTY